jgi:hypothetical protein
MRHERDLGTDRGGVGSGGTEREIERVENYVKGGLTRSEQKNPITGLQSTTIVAIPKFIPRQRQLVKADEGPERGWQLPEAVALEHKHLQACGRALLPQYLGQMHGRRSSLGPSWVIGGSPIFELFSTVCRLQTASLTLFLSYSTLTRRRVRGFRRGGLFGTCTWTACTVGGFRIRRWILSRRFRFSGELKKYREGSLPMCTCWRRFHVWISSC